MSGSYEQILREHGPLPVDDVVALGVAAAAALHAAHQAGRVHGDVRPAMLRRTGPVVDFGAAQPGELAGVGPAPHASPEALLGQAQSGLSDVYSLASSLWTLLTGHPPYLAPGTARPDLAAFRDRVLHEPLPPMPAHVPAWLTAELTRALAKWPTQRHPSAQ
ncbi:MAG: protein kinase domain-containing protein, partial [Micromonosporaceae bacterium]